MKGRSHLLTLTDVSLPLLPSSILLLLLLLFFHAVVLEIVSKCDDRPHFASAGTAFPLDDQMGPWRRCCPCRSGYGNTFTHISSVFLRASCQISPSVAKIWNCTEQRRSEPVRLKRLFKIAPRNRALKSAPPHTWVLKGSYADFQPEERLLSHPDDVLWFTLKHWTLRNAENTGVYR